MNENPYEKQMDEAMAELLKILKGRSTEVGARLKAADLMDDISFHAIQAEVIREVSTTTQDKADKMTAQLKKLNKKQPWEDEDGE